MANIPRHSTRLMHFHLRNFRGSEGDESEMFSARIYHGDHEVGFARNEGSGGPDIIHIHPPHRDRWEAFVRYMVQHPVAVADDGTPEEMMGAEETAMLVLREIHHAERELIRSRKYRSGLLGFTWTQPFQGSGWWAEATVLLSEAQRVSAEAADADVFRLLVLGRDNDGFTRDAPAPASNPQQ